LSKESGIREAGRGFVLITGAKLWFLVTATFTSLAFPRLFGDQVLFGQFRVVSGILNVFTMVVITASVQAVSKLASESGADIRQIRRTAFTGQMLFFGPIFLLFCGLSGVIANSLLNDPGIATPLLVASLVVAAYMIYAALIGILNGTRNFGRQAGMDILFSTLKTVLMIAAVVASGSVALAYGGFAATAWIVLLVAFFVTGKVVNASAPGTERPGLLGRYFMYLLPLAAYALVLNLLLQADVIWLKAILGRGADASVTGAADNASRIAGVYGAAKNVALLPYQAVISMTFIVFPLVSTASSSGDRQGASNVVSGAFRLAAILSWGAVALIGAAPKEILALLYGKGYEAGADGLIILLAAGALLAFMYVGNAVLASSGRPIVSVLGGLGAVAVQAGLLLAMPWLTSRDHASSWAAIATTAGAFCGAVVAGILTARIHQKLQWVWTFASSVVSAAAGLGVSFLLDGHVPWIVKPVAAFVVFAVVLVLTRGTGREDLDVVLSVVRRRRKK